MFHTVSYTGLPLNFTAQSRIPVYLVFSLNFALRNYCRSKLLRLTSLCNVRSETTEYYNISLENQYSPPRIAFCEGNMNFNFQG